MNYKNFIFAYMNQVKLLPQTAISVNQPVGFTALEAIFKLTQFYIHDSILKDKVIIYTHMRIIYSYMQLIFLYYVGKIFFFFRFFKRITEKIILQFCPFTLQSVG